MYYKNQKNYLGRNPMPKTHIIILAGGKGTRMNIDCPKVLFKIKEKPMITHVLESVTKVCPRPTIVVGYKGDDVINELGGDFHYVWQKEQLGTGHAVICAKPELSGSDPDSVMILLGDHPLISPETIARIVDFHEKANVVITMSSVAAPNFEGDFARFYHYGRIIRNQEGNVEKIIELKDATEEEREVKEINVSYYCFNAKWLWDNIGKLKNENAAGEYYLTDMIGMAVAENQKIGIFTIENPIEGFGVNSVDESRVIEKHLRG